MADHDVEAFRSWDQLPEEVLEAIFVLSKPYHLPYIRLVCQFWLAPANRTIATLAPTKFLPPNLSQFSSLQRLSLAKCFSAVQAQHIPIILEQCPSLMSLNLQHCTAVTRLILRPHTTLTDLNLSQTSSLTGPVLLHLSLLPSLRALYIAHCDWATDEELQSLPSSASHLTLLRLPRCSSITETGLLPLHLLTALHHLDLSACPRVFNDTLAVLTQLPQLRSLKLSKVQYLAEPGLRSVGALTALTHLDLSDNRHLDNSSLSALHPLSSLRSLSLADCIRLTGSSLQHITSTTTLQTLDLKGVLVTFPLGSRHLCPFPLTSLSLSGNGGPIIRSVPRGASAILEFITQHHPHLTHLCFTFFDFRPIGAPLSSPLGQSATSSAAMPATPPEVSSPTNASPSTASPPDPSNAPPPNASPLNAPLPNADAANAAPSYAPLPSAPAPTHPPSSTPPCITSPPSSPPLDAPLAKQAIPTSIPPRSNQPQGTSHILPDVDTTVDPPLERHSQGAAHSLQTTSDHTPHPPHPPPSFPSSSPSPSCPSPSASSHPSKCNSPPHQPPLNTSLEATHTHTRTHTPATAPSPSTPSSASPPSEPSAPPPLPPTLAYTRTPHTSTGSLSSLELCPLLTQLHLGYSRHLRNADLAVLSALTALEVLSLELCVEIGDEGMPHIAAARNLRSLNLTCCNISNWGVQQLAPLIALTSLDLSSCPHISHLGLNVGLEGCLDIFSLGLQRCDCVQARELLPLLEAARRRHCAMTHRCINAAMLMTDLVTG